MNKRRIGTDWEGRAADFLEKQGYTVLEKNFRCREGEIDLIAKDGDYLVFVEVRYRKTAAKGHPFETVNMTKQKKICRVSQYYLMKNKISPDAPIRYDVVAVLGERIEIMKNAFEYRSI